jgi:Na+/H+-translocating membrane pyrophosphatase
MSGVDGQATLIVGDAFTGAELTWAGTKHSSGGTWDNSKKEYTVSFDILDVTQGCVLKLTRTGDCK